jgi:hypothetical protein
MITSYFEFFHKIFEANELELAESFIVKLYKARMLASEKVKAKAKKLEEEPNISDADLKKYLNKDVKLTSEQEKEAKDIALTDPYYNRIIFLTEKKKEWLPSFLQLFFSHFKNSRPNAENDYDLISGLIGEYSIIAGTNYGDIRVERLVFGDIGDSRAALNKGSIGNSIDKMLQLNPKIVKKILSTIPEIVKIMNIQNTDLSKITMDSFKQIVKGVLPEDFELDSEDDVERAKEILRTERYSRKGYEILSDSVRDLSKMNDIEFLVSRLPKGIESEDSSKKRSNLIKEYENLSDSDKLTSDSEYTKRDLKNLLGDFVDICYRKNIPLKLVKSEKGDVKYPYEDIFQIRRGTRLDKQLDKNLDDFYKRLSKTIDSLNNAGVSTLIDNINEANDKYGDGSVVVVFNEDNKVVISINNYRANHFLHDQTIGKKQTNHCIAYDESHWNSNVGEDNKLYYVYNFNLDRNSVLLPFGVIIQPNGKVHSSFDRKDENGMGQRKSLTQEQVEEHMRDYGIPYDVLQPMSAEDIEEKEFRRNSLNLLVKTDLSVEYLKKILATGIDPNHRNGQAMINALNEDNIEKVKILIKAGARLDNLGVGGKSSIVYASSLEALILLMQNVVKIKKKEEAHINNIITGDILKPNFTTNISTLLELIPKYSVTKADIKLIPAHDIYERMLDLAYKLNNLPLFKVIVDATKKRLLEDFEEPDFLAEFINRGIVKAVKYKEILINTVKSVYADDPEYVEELIQKINR